MSDTYTTEDTRSLIHLAIHQTWASAVDAHKRGRDRELAPPDSVVENAGHIDAVFDEWHANRREQERIFIELKRWYTAATGSEIENMDLSELINTPVWDGGVGHESPPVQLVKKADEKTMKSFYEWREEYTKSAASDWKVDRLAMIAEETLPLWINKSHQKARRNLQDAGLPDELINQILEN